MPSHQRREHEPQAVCNVQVVDGASLEIGSADVTAAADNERLAHQLVEAFNAADLPRMRALLAEDRKAYITNALGGIDEVDGPDERCPPRATSSGGRDRLSPLPPSRFLWN